MQVELDEISSNPKILRPHTVHKLLTNRPNITLSSEIIFDKKTKIRHSSFCFRPKKHRTPDDLLSLLIERKPIKSYETWESPKELQSPLP